VRRSHDISNARLFLLLIMTLATLDGVSCWLGPFVLVPQAIAITALWAALAVDTSRERWGVFAFTAVAMVLPFALQLLGVFSPAWRFSGGELVLAARGVRLTSEGTIPGLIWSATTFAVIPVVYFGRIRDALSAAERQLFVQAWHLKQLLR
jgi:serine/threonine-protein kinase